MTRTGGLLALLLCLGTASAYYLPGTYPQEFLVGDVIQGKNRARTAEGQGVGWPRHPSITPGRASSRQLAGQALTCVVGLATGCCCRVKVSTRRAVGRAVGIAVAAQVLDLPPPCSLAIAAEANSLVSSEVRVLLLLFFKAVAGPLRTCGRWPVETAAPRLDYLAAAPPGASIEEQHAGVTQVCPTCSRGHQPLG